MAQVQRVTTRRQYPAHEYADRHKAIRARDEIVGNKRRLRDASELQPSGECAAERLREFMWDLGAEAREANPNRWMASVSEALEMNSSTGWRIMTASRPTVRTETIDHVCRVTGIPVRVFYDPEL